MKTIAARAAGLIVAASLTATAQTSLNWNLAGSGGTGTIGNSKTFTTDGVMLRATAWGYTKGSSDNAFEAARLGQWSAGLGVTNVHEDGSSPYHQADNAFHNDWILFVFDTLVDIGSVKVQPSPGPYDRDVSYWVGNIDPALNLDGVTYAGLTALGFTAEQIVNNPAGSSAIDVAINSPASGVNALLFGPRRGTGDACDFDAFKVQSICATVVPEPSSALLSLLAACGVCIRRRR